MLPILILWSLPAAGLSCQQRSPRSGMRSHTQHAVHKGAIMGDRITGFQHLKIKPTGELYCLLAAEKQ